jgi:hypothetical protein
LKEALSYSPCWTGLLRAGLRRKRVDGATTLAANGPRRESAETVEFGALRTAAYAAIST